MDAIVALCKRRGFVYQSSEIYGGFGGLWDYGPLGVELKRNIKDAWWRDMITTHDELDQPEGAPRTFQMVGIESSIIIRKPNIYVNARCHFESRYKFESSRNCGRVTLRRDRWNGL